MNIEHYTYRVTWSPKDNEHVGLCVELPSLSWLATTPEEALTGIRQLVATVIKDMQSNGEVIPEVHCTLAMQTAEQGISLNRLASAKLAG